MGETTKGGDATKPPSSSSSPPKDSSLDHHHRSHHQHHNLHHHHQHQPFLPSPIYIPAAAAVSSPPPPPFQSNSPIIPKRPRYGSSDSAPSQLQWTTLPSSALPSSTETPGSSSPISPQLQEPTNNEKPPETESFHHKYRKGKYVSPVWKPNEMLWLARAWRVQYQQQTGSGSGSGENQETSTTHSGKAKTRADKDREVAEFLNRHGINRDAKTAGTKWDNMLGEFRKVYEWERNGDVEKSYFRLSPYERKQHKLPASFDEQVFQELSLFMSSRARTPTLTRATAGATATMTLTPPPPPLITSRDDDDSPFPSIGRGKRLALAVVGDNNPQFPHSNTIVRGASSFSKSMYDPSSEMIPSSSSSSSVKDLRRIGKIRLTWEESVSLWAEEGEIQQGRIKVSGSSFLNADELTYLDDSMVPCTMESFKDGSLKGFSLDKFVSGQHVKVFGRRKSTTSSSAPSPSVPGLFDRVQLPLSEPILRSISTWEFQDPSEHYLSTLRVPPPTLPSLFDLSWHIQEPPPENLRFPLRKDVYKELPPEKDLFFTTSGELLDCRSITYDIISPIMGRLNPNTLIISSKDSLIPVWDDCVNRMVSKFCPGGITLIRKPSLPSSCNEPIQDQWPNVIGFVKGLGLWRGEETDKIRETETETETDPSSLLLKKLLWSYNDLPYILGYHATGYTVTFCALSRSQNSQNRVICNDLCSFDISLPSDRLKALVPCYRLACLLPLLADRCIRHSCYSDFERIEERDCVTEITPHTVTKYYTTKRKWSEVKEIYDSLDQRVPHTEHLEKSNEKELWLSFKPRGIKSKPRNVDELIESLKCVTKALVALHDFSYMHRDMGWEKVMRNVINGPTEEEEVEWFVCGFDEAKNAPQLNPFDHQCSYVKEEEERGRHAPEMGRGLHGVKVDVWGIGYMIKTCGVCNVPKMLRELEGMCLEMSPENRPTAADCYHHLIQVQSSTTSY